MTENPDITLLREAAQWLRVADYMPDEARQIDDFADRLTAERAETARLQEELRDANDAIAALERALGAGRAETARLREALSVSQTESARLRGVIEDAAKSLTWKLTAPPAPASPATCSRHAPNTCEPRDCAYAIPACMLPEPAPVSQVSITYVPAGRIQARVFDDPGPGDESEET